MPVVAKRRGVDKGGEPASQARGEREREIEIERERERGWACNSVFSVLIQ